MPGASPFHAALTTPLLSFGRDLWRIADAVEGTAIWGAVGSGKTSGSGKAIAKAFLSAGMGGLVLCAKTDERATWEKYAKATGRSDDVVIVDASGAQRFNILDWASKNIATAGFESNLVDLMTRMSEAASVAGSKGKGEDNAYFVNNAMQWVANAFPMLLLAYGTIRMREVKDYITSAPATPAEAKQALERIGNMTPADLDDPDVSFLLKTLMLAGGRVEALEIAARIAKERGEPEAAAIKAQYDHAFTLLEQHSDFFLDEYPRLDGKPRSGIETTLTGLIYPFLSGKLAELFCTETTFSPDDCRDGKIIIMDLPSLRYGAGGTTAQTLFKYLFGMAIQRRPIEAAERAVFIYADEAQNFLNSSDADLLATARSSKTCVVYLTQDLPTYYAKLGKDSQDVAESILSKFGTRIFHASLSKQTNEYAIDLIGKIEKFHRAKNRQWGHHVGGGGNMHDDGGGYHGNDGENRGGGESESGYLDHELTADYFSTRLRKGAEANKFKVDGIVVRNGEIFQRTKRHWIKAEFSQKA